MIRKSDFFFLSNIYVNDISGCMTQTRERARTLDSAKPQFFDCRDVFARICTEICKPACRHSTMCATLLLLRAKKFVNLSYCENVLDVWLMGNILVNYETLPADITAAHAPNHVKILRVTFLKCVQVSL